LGNRSPIGRNIPLFPRFKDTDLDAMSKIRNSARMEECQVRIPFICNGTPETTVLAHLNGGGMGKKHHDIHGAYCCSACHDAIDGRSKTSYTKDQLKLWHLEGIIRTQKILIENNLILTVSRT